MATFSQGIVDAILNAMRTRFDNSGGSAVLSLYSAGNVLLGSVSLPATPFAAVGAGATGYRQFNANGLPLSSTGAAGAAGGTNATYALARNEAGGADVRLTVGLTGSGAEVELDNVNIAQDQVFNIIGYGYRMPYDSTLS